jgi:hypothetical protein
MLRTWDIVVVSPDFEDEDIRGKRGHICSLVDADGFAVLTILSASGACATTM